MLHDHMINSAVTVNVYGKGHQSLRSTLLSTLS